MTDSLAKKWCELVGFPRCQWPSHERDSEFSVIVSDASCKKLSWFFTGDGMLAVKQEMAKRGKCIGSGVLLFAPGGWSEFVAEDGTRSKPAFHADTEPEAVLLAAVAALESEAGK